MTMPTNDTPNRGPAARSMFPRDRRGAMLAFVAVTMVGIMGMLVMTLDVGAGHRQRRIAQTAADAGAIAGATEIYRLQTSDTVIASAQNEAVRNGYDAADVTVNYPPATGPYTGNNQYVEVIITKNIPTIFGSIFSKSSLDIAARGVAGVGSSSLDCVYSLDPDGKDALLLDGDMTANCGVTVNSTHAQAIYVHPGKDLIATHTAVAGGTYGAGDIVPAATTGVAPVPNPLAYVQMPVVGPCDFATQYVVNGDETLNPGVYCGGINIATGGATATLNPGTYILAGGGLQVATSGNIIGTGVTIVNTNGPGGNQALYAPIALTNSCDADLSAPTTGPLKGIIFFIDPAAPADVVNTYSCDGTIVGTFYAPNQTFYFANGNGKLEIVGGIVAKNIQVKEGSSVTMTGDPTGASALKRLSLVQ